MYRAAESKDLTDAVYLNGFIICNLFSIICSLCKSSEYSISQFVDNAVDIIKLSKYEKLYLLWISSALLTCFILISEI